MGDERLLFQQHDDFHNGKRGFQNMYFFQIFKEITVAIAQKKKCTIITGFRLVILTEGR